MRRILNYIITNKEDGLTVHQFLKAHGYSNAVFVQLKKTNYGIMVNGIWYYVSDKLRAGDTLTVTLEETDSSTQILPVFLPLSILYEDEDILLINKASGMPIHPSCNHHDNTLANGVMYYYMSQETSYVFRCVNRLDRDTTGLTILAKNMLSSAVLSRQLKNHEIQRTYLAVVEGMIPKSGTIDAPIARKADSVIERMVSFDGGEHAVTHYRRLAYQNGLSLTALRLETGRTHQIRVHMKYIGHPLIGDFLYNPESSLMSRQALHACSLAFMHPIKGVPVSYSVPLPDDMHAFFPEFSMDDLQHLF